jgi:5-methylcytosine-specific restriction endonuclease McrA
LSDNLDETLAIAADVLRNPAFPQSELDKFKARFASQVEYQRSLPSFIAQEQFLSAVYDEHPGGLIVPPENVIARPPARERVAAPLVIRLKRFVHVPRRFRRQVTNTFLFARDGYRCQYCGRHKGQLRGREFLTRDHVLPLSRGGDNTWENVATACSACNNRKASHLPEEIGMHLLHKPKEPNYVELVWAVRRVTAVQAKYIAMFYGEEVLAALLRHSEEGHGHAHGHEPTRHLALVD